MRCRRWENRIASGSAFYLNGLVPTLCPKVVLLNTSGRMRFAGNVAKYCIQFADNNVTLVIICEHHVPSVLNWLHKLRSHVGRFADNFIYIYTYVFVERVCIYIYRARERARKRKHSCFDCCVHVCIYMYVVREGWINLFAA